LANPVDIPSACAWRMIKLKGRKVPKKNKKLARAVARNGGSLSGLTNSMMIKGLGRVSRRDLTVRLAMIMRPRIIKAAVRMDQAKPIWGMRRSIIMLRNGWYPLLRTVVENKEWRKRTHGRITPPSDDPEVTIPKASALLLKNHVATELFAAKKIALAPTALQIPCASRN